MSKAAEMAADWWTERLQRGDKVKFRHQLVGMIDAELAMRGRAIVAVDYDPDDILVVALLAAGLEDRRWCLLSAKDILPMKTALRVYPDRLEPKEGYGNWTAHIPVPAE
jgi:hypothetical protein